jgi:polynucleotide 5'-hydroxyl-kinase GRC3/NOL9
MVAAADAPFVIVDTTGLIHGPGGVLKAYQIDSIEPDAVVCIEQGRELEPLFRSHRTRKIIRISASRRAVAKTREERIAARKQAFETYFRGAGEVILSLDDVAFQRFPLFGGTPIDVEGCIHAEKQPLGIVGVSDRPERVGRHKMRVFSAGFERNLLCGVMDNCNEIWGLAILERIDLSAKKLCLFTPVFPERYRHPIFVADHGSWNRMVPIGYRIMLLRLAENRAVDYEVSAQGRLQGIQAWGVPVDVLAMPDGALPVSDDRAGAIYRIHYQP